MKVKILKSKRVLLGVSQKELAERLGVTAIWIGEVENLKQESPKLKKRIEDELKKIEIEKYGISIPTLS